MTNFDDKGAAALDDYFPNITVSLEEADRRARQLADFVRQHMVEGEDYGVVPGTNTKPTLFKSGAEKLNTIFGFAPLVSVVHRVEDWENGFVSYEVKVTLLNKRNGQIEAEGIGSCNSRERRYKNQDAANMANIILKMSKKRALVDATLTATRSSGMFVQEADDVETDAAAAPRRWTRPAPAKPSEAVANPAVALTEKQREAILGNARRQFGRDAEVELPKLLGKSVGDLTKSEASAALDKLAALAGEKPAPR